MEYKFFNLMNLLVILLGAVVLVQSFMIYAELIDRGAGLIYDTDLDVTWLANANFAATELSDDRMLEIITAVGLVDNHVLTQDDFLKNEATGVYTGQMSWWGAEAWIDRLRYFDTIRGVYYDDWRLPTMHNSDSGCTGLFGGARIDSLGYNCSDGELGHLFYVDLGGKAELETASLETSNDPDLSNFIGIQLDYYHFGTTYADCPNISNVDCNAYFSFYSGFQWATEKRNMLFVWAVRDGDVALLDSDGDSVSDNSDNCTLIPNPAQCDGDNDGYGNHCDADFNNDDIVSQSDIWPLLATLGVANPITDLTCNGIVNRQDIWLFRYLFGLPPGPSALAP